MKKVILFFVAIILLFTGCEDVTPVDPNGEGSFTPLKKYPSDLAVNWMKLQQRLSRTTTGFGPGPATRAFAYSGLALYESIVEGMPGYRSVASSMIGTNITSHEDVPVIYWPASANAAMASILRNLIPNASTENKARIDSLESVFNSQFSNEASTIVLEHSIEYGRRVAGSIFDWSKSDGVAEANAKNGSYVIPTGPGLWERTPPALAAPINVYIGDTRTFVLNSASVTLPPPPTVYSTDVGSDFHNMSKEVYTISQSLTADDLLTIKTWGEFPGNYTNALRYIQIAIQLVDEANLPLDLAALSFAKHNMAMQEAIVCVFKAKYTYNLIRPISYIRNVMGYAIWNAINPTPPHPEYPAAHATVGRASSRVLESIFGTNYSFVDRTHESLYGARLYSTLKEYSDEAGWSRVIGGIHYTLSVEAGWEQGEQVGDLINQLPFRD